MKKLFPSLLAAGLTLSMLCTAAACGTGNGRRELTGALDQTDLQTGFLRTAGSGDYDNAFSAVEEYNDKIVGVFYFLWLSQASNDTTIEDFVKDNKSERTVTGTDVSGAPAFTWWGEPMYGYYQVEDEWVVRKHVELFMNAGLDFICFDTTNNDYYAAAAQKVLDVLLEYSQLGYKVPKVMFMTNSDSSGMITSIYNAFYRRNTYDEIWFTGRGEKPWILGTYTGSNAKISERFYFKKAQWPNRAYDENNFPWMSWRYPQEIFRDSAQGYKIMNVSVSQHTAIGGPSDVPLSGINFSISGLCAPYAYSTLSDSLKAVITPEKAERYYNANWGRGYSHETGANNYENALKNVNFDEQWATAINNDSIDLVFVTGWNEWVAQKQSKDPLLGENYGYFVDTFNMEFSRDIEMMNGGYLDNCFLQLVQHIRSYKGAGSVSNDQSAVAANVDLYDLANWEDIAAYADLVKETLPRDHAGAGSNHYKNDTGRNDIKEVRAAVQGDDLYFLVTTVDPLTERAADDTRYMNLWLGTGGTNEGFAGLNYVINRKASNGKASIDRVKDGTFESAGECEVTAKGNHMLFKVKKEAVGLSGTAFGLRFKVTDNLQKDFDVTDLYTNGDCAPIGRISYSYYTK